MFCHSSWDDHHLLSYVFRPLQGFLGDLVGSLGEDATLGDVLPDIGWTQWCCDDLGHLKQGTLFPQAGNGRECGWVWGMPIPTSSDTPDGVSQQNPTRACGGGEVGLLLWGLRPEHWQMLAHKVDGKNPVTYTDLLLDAPKAGKMARSQRSSAPKNATAGSSNITHSHPQGNLFPSRKLKGSCTFTVWSVVVEDHETKEDSCPKADGEKEAESSAEEDAGTTGNLAM